MHYLYPPASLVYLHITGATAADKFTKAERETTELRHTAGLQEELS
jgi:hypothetical protein